MRLFSVFCLVVIGVFSTEQISANEKSEDPRREVLLYGIDSDVASVLSDLIKEKISSYNALLTEVYKETRDSEIKQGIYRVWEETEYKEALSFGRNEILTIIEDYDYSEPVIRSAISYLAELEDEEAVPLLMELIDFRDTAIAAAAVRAIGTIGMTEKNEDSPLLLKRLENADPHAEEELTAALITTLGQLRYEASADHLILIAEDSQSSLGHRRLASIAVGRIGRPEDYPIIERIYYESDDALLRSYALSGLADFKNIDSTDALIQALKRDAFWRIRTIAAEKLAGQKSEDILNLLRYKAENDPVKQVKIAALSSLGVSEDRKSQEFLMEYYLSEKNSTETRLAALDVLAKNHINGTVETVEKIMNKFWEKDDTRFLEFTCRNLSLIEWQGLEKVFERMLGHPAWMIVLYGIRGIRRSGIESLYESINDLDVDGTDSRIRREIGLDLGVR